MMQKFQAFLIANLIFLLTASMPASAQYLSCQGKDIVGPDGQPVLLRGIGLGGWLVPEGYMLHIPGYGSPTSIRNMILDLIGEADTEQFYTLYRANYVTEEDIRTIAGWGFNSIRLPFHYEILSPRDQPGVFLEKGFAIIDSVLAWCARNELYLILDMHCAPGGQNPNNISDSDGEAKLWTIPANQDRTVEIWRKIAERYAREPWIGGYDLLNEPVLPQGYSNLDLRNLYRRLALAIREIDENHILFLEGNWYATDFSDLAPPILYGKNVVYSFHKYWSENSLSSIQQFLGLRSNWKVPLWMGESGENSNPWFYSAIRLFEENNIGWCWWTHKKIQTTTSPYSSPISPGYQRVLDYWNGQASRPDAATARTGLFEMAQNLATARCEFRPDVLHAMFNPGFNSQPAPYASHSIPGTIPCAEYDLGNVNVAYFDKDYERVRWDTWQPWNQGGEFRNDGVDLERSKDAQGAKYSVGWIATGEWLKYTVQVEQEGLYEVRFRTAAPAGNGILRLDVDGKTVVSGLAVPASGGWYTWQDVTVKNIALPAGQHLLTLHFVREGFNFNQMHFRLLTATDIEESETPGPVRAFALYQNYPNPFNPETRIAFDLARESVVRMTVYDLNGKEIVTLLRQRTRPGRREAVWDGTDTDGNRVPAGIYVYRLQVGSAFRTRKMILLN